MTKHKWLLIILIVLVLVVSLLLIGLELLVYSHMYPQDSFKAKSNLSIKEVVTFIEENHRKQGMVPDDYHFYHFYYRLNITEIMWVDDLLANWTAINYVNNTVNGWGIIGVGYDNLDNPQVAVGQTVNCKGYYTPYTDTSSSFIITVSPSINESYLKVQT